MPEAFGSGTKRSPCGALRRDGQPCQAPGLMGDGRCFAHTEMLSGADRDRVRRRGGAGSARTARVQRLLPTTLKPVLQLLLDALDETHTGTLDAKQAGAMAALASAICRVYASGQLEERLSALEQAERDRAVPLRRGG